MSSSDSQSQPQVSSPAPSHDPVAAADQFLYKYSQGMSIHDRFKDIPAPGGAMLFKKLKESYTVGHSLGGRFAL
jgi:hypothetical protein